MNCQEVTAVDDEIIADVNQRVNVYPNPVGDIVKVKIPEVFEQENLSSEKIEIRMYDNMGNSVKKITNLDFLKSE